MLLGAMFGNSVTGDTAPTPAVGLGPNAKAKYLLRASRTDTRPFRLITGQTFSDDLTSNSTAAEVTQALASIGVSDATVIGRGVPVGPDDLPWNFPVWWIACDEPPEGGLLVEDDAPQGSVSAQIYPTADWPNGLITNVYPRYAGDPDVLYPGSIVHCRMSPGLGYRVWSATLQAEVCPAQNAKVRIVLYGPPTGGTWSLTLISPVIDPDTNQFPEETFAGLAWNITAAALQDLLDDSTHFAAGVRVSRGPAHQAGLDLEFVDELGAARVAAPSVNWGSLDGEIVGANVYYLQLGRGEELRP
jgi:hypothetical protein